jgi:hypothetical protein
MNVNRISKGLSLVVVSAGLAGMATASWAQRSQNLFRGFWKGTLSPDVIVGVPEEDVERLKRPFDFELRVFNRGRVEVYFLANEEEWEFTGREFQLTEIGANGVINGRLTGSGDASQNGFSFNLTKIDDETLLLDWTMLSTQTNLRFDGFDEIGFAGTDILKLSDD